MEMISTHILDLREIDQSMTAIAGGKGANLGELSRMENFEMPDGFCITTSAFTETIVNSNSFKSLLDQLALLKTDNRKGISDTSAKIRSVIEEIEIPKNIHDEIIRKLKKAGEKGTYAIRSSATAEDLPTASFAGQLDTYLNISGNDAVLQHIIKCWASLFTDRAVIYRLQNGIDHKKISMSVVIQKMIFPDVSGIMFTADPVTSNRRILSIDAGFGLGEALVSGIINADNYRVREGRIISKKISTKKLLVMASEIGGTRQQEIAPGLQNAQTISDAEIIELERIGRKIEAHFGKPQDIEWGLAGGRFFIFQSRPVTTLFPIPETDDQENHLFVSVGHQQMMTDAMKPLGISVWQLTAGRPMYKAGGRLFVDVVKDLASPVKREIVMNVLGKSDPLFKAAMTTIMERGDFIHMLSDDHIGKMNQEIPVSGFQTLRDYDPQVVHDLIRNSQTSTEELQKKIQTKSGPDLIDFILEDIQLLKKILSDSQSFGVIMTAMNAALWINEKIHDWLGDKNVADTLSQSVPNNITSEMGLALLDVADTIRPYPELIEYLQNVKDENFLDELLKFKGGKEARDAINAFLSKFGMRCSGEIDITKTRWSEKPTILVSLILSNIKNFSANEGGRKFEQGRLEALLKEEELLERLKKLPDGVQKASETKRMIGLVRNLSGYREYPKYSIVIRYFIYKQALLKEAEQLAEGGVILEKEDIFFLTLEELRETILINKPDYRIISDRKNEYKSYEKLIPPRVITSDGEIVAGKYNRENLPVAAIPGLPVSAGMIEGRARIILNLEEADLEDGDILVTSYTDPAWTTLFVSIKGLVTEVGGLMTHGAVIAREYGIPAVVGVENATRILKDGQRIRVNGTDGYVEVL